MISALNGLSLIGFAQSLTAIPDPPFVKPRPEDLIRPGGGSRPNGVPPVITLPGVPGMPSRNIPTPPRSSGGVSPTPQEAESAKPAGIVDQITSGISQAIGPDAWLRSLQAQGGLIRISLINVVLVLILLFCLFVIITGGIDLGDIVNVARTVATRGAA